MLFGRNDSEYGKALMGWSIGFDTHWNRDIGYGVPAECDQPQCGTAIDRGLSYVCGGEPYGGEKGCGLYFCEKHRNFDNLCGRCRNRKPPHRAKSDCFQWTGHKRTHPSWAQWRKEQKQ